MVVCIIAAFTSWCLHDCLFHILMSASVPTLKMDIIIGVEVNCMWISILLPSFTLLSDVCMDSDLVSRRLRGYRVRDFISARMTTSYVGADFKSGCLDECRVYIWMSPWALNLHMDVRMRAKFAPSCTNVFKFYIWVLTLHTAVCMGADHSPRWMHVHIWIPAWMPTSYLDVCMNYLKYNNKHNIIRSLKLSCI